MSIGMFAGGVFPALVVVPAIWTTSPLLSGVNVGLASGLPLASTYEILPTCAPTGFWICAGVTPYGFNSVSAVAVFGVPLRTLMPPVAVVSIEVIGRLDDAW